MYDIENGSYNSKLNFYELMLVFLNLVLHPPDMLFDRLSFLTFLYS